MRDGNETAEEFRHYLRLAPAEKLFTYARHCLEKPFAKSGLVLQDIVNELGRRLSFDVENGLYQGKQKHANFDRLWRVNSDPELIIEVKTTDYVTISLDKLADYKARLLAEGKVRNRKYVK